MKKILIAIVLFSFSLSALSQVELPEPTAPEIAYAFQISWGSKTSLAWVDVTPKSVIVSAGQAATIHNYYGKIGDNIFELIASDSTVANPKKVIGTFEILNTPSKWFDIFRIRAKATINHPDSSVISSAWSDPSFWTLVIDIKKLSMPTGVK